jgi:acetylornithine deacetylase
VITDREREVLKLIEDGKGDIVDCLQTLISFKTITPPGNDKVETDDYQNLQEFVGGFLGQLGFQIETWDVDAEKLDRFPGSGVKADRDLRGMPVLAGKREGTGDGKSLILNGHYDVVPPGILGNWKHNPFGGVIEGNKIYGRGACDMKGGIAAMLLALKFIQRSGIELNGDLTVQTVPEEETSCMGTLSCCQRGYTADAAIIPEPTDMQVLIAMRGGIYGKITVFGRAGHAEMTQPHWSKGGAVNAISKACKVVAALEDLSDQWQTQPDKQHKYLDPDIILPTVIKGGEWQVTYPEEVEIDFGAIGITGTKDKQEEIEEQLMRVAATDPWMREHPPEIKFNEEWFYGAEVDENEPIVQVGMQSLADLGVGPKLRGFGSLTDAIHLINYAKVPTISFGPTIKTAHMANEYVEIDELVTTAQALALAIMRWSG